MKFQVNFKVAAKTSTRTEVFDFIASPTDTIASLKERLAAAQRISFPDQDLLFNGEVLIDASRLCDCGVKESSSLDFVVKVSEDGVVKQLIQLLLTCALSIDELSMSYSYKYGESVSQVLKTIGEDSKLEDFLKKQKVFRVKDGRAMLANDGSKTLAKAKDGSENHAASKLHAEATLANRVSQVFKEQPLVFRESRKAFQDALEELEAEESKQYAPKLVFRESRKAFQDALEDLEVEQSQRFMANQGFKKQVFRETHLAIHLAVEELERSFQ